MKPGIAIITIDSVESAIKFYTEKLGFDIVHLKAEKNDFSSNSITFAKLKKGKCVIMFKAPEIEELAEYSFIKRCSSRSVCLFIEMKKGIDKFYQKCQKKNLSMHSTISDKAWGYRTFSIKDPFGLKLTFAQPLESKQESNVFLNSEINSSQIKPKIEDNSLIIESIIKYLKNFKIKSNNNGN